MGNKRRDVLLSTLHSTTFNITFFAFFHIPSNERSTKDVGCFRQIGGKKPRGSAEPSLRFRLSPKRRFYRRTLLFRSPWFRHRQPWLFRSLGLFSSQTEPPPPKVLHFLFPFSSISLIFSSFLDPKKKTHFFLDLGFSFCPYGVLV